MIGRIGHRDAFERFRGSSRSVRAGSLRVSVIAPDPDAPAVAVAFSISRRAGSAVRRNRVRRQLREVFQALHDEGRLPEGWYLVTVRPRSSHAEHRFDQLRESVESALAGLHPEGGPDV